MTKLARYIARFSEWIIHALELILLAITIFGLIEWWGSSWLVAVLWPVALFIVVFVVVYRLIRGKWPNFFATALGSLTGCGWAILIFPGLLIFPIVYRFVEGEWHVTYLCLWAALFVVRLVQEFFQREKAHS